MMKKSMALAAAVTLPLLAACTGATSSGTAMPAGNAVVGQATGQAAGQATAFATSALTPTVIARRAPPPTATVDAAKEPMAPVAVEGLPGIVVPAAARLVRLDEGSSTEDALGAFGMSDTDGDELAAWFEEQLGAEGWVLEGERDGALLFEHSADTSARFAEEGLKRSATVFFDVAEELKEGETGFTIVVEMPLEP